MDWWWVTPLATLVLLGGTGVVVDNYFEKLDRVKLERRRAAELATVAPVAEGESRRSSGRP